MSIDGLQERPEILVIEGDEALADQLLLLLESTGEYLPRFLAPDRALMAPPGWAGPAVLLVGLDVDRAQRLAYARRVQGAYPGAIIIGYTVNFIADTLLEAMNWGARRVLRYPFEPQALRQAILDIEEELRGIVRQGHASAPPSGRTQPPAAVPDPAARNRVVAVFSPKGGVGTSTLAVNLAVALQLMGHPTSLVDGNISFGSLDVFLNLEHNRSMLQLVGDVELVNSETVQEALVAHRTGLQVLLAPSLPEEADGIRGEHMQRILGVLNQQFRFTLIDTWPSFDERVLAVLEVADVVLVPIGPDLPAMKQLKQFLRVAQLLNYDMSKFTLILMRANSVPPGHLKDIEEFLAQPLTLRVVSDGKRATAAANTGTPFVISARDAQISQDVFAIAKFLVGATDGAAGVAKAKAKPQQVGSGRFWRR